MRNYLILILASAIFTSCYDKPATDNGDNDWVAESTEFDITLTHRDTAVIVQYTAPDTVKVTGLVLNGEDLTVDVSGEKTLGTELLLPGLNKLECYFTSSGKPDTLYKEFVFAVKKGYELVNTYAHNPEHFTQGLYFNSKGSLVESTGMEGRSKIIFYNFSGNQFIAKDSVLNPSNEFGEGVAESNGDIVQLTWQNRLIKIYDSATGKLRRTLSYPDEGWGICTDGKTFYVSNGSYNLKTVDLSGNDAVFTRIFPVTGPNGNVNYLNELEYIDGLIYANVWQSNSIEVIEPSTGAVVAEIDLSEFVNREKSISNKADVLNGIAFNRKTGTLLITGKQWSNFYEIRITDKKTIAAVV